MGLPAAKSASDVRSELVNASLTHASVGAARHSRSGAPIPPARLTSSPSGYGSSWVQPMVRARSHSTSPSAVLEWLAARAQREQFVDGRHFVIVAAEPFDQEELGRWLDRPIASVEAPTGPEVGEKLARLS